MKIERPKSIQPMPDDAKLVHKGAIFDVYQWQQEMFDGSFSTFEKLKRADTAQIIPVTKEGMIVMIEDCQPGKGTWLNIPGGRIEEGEDAEEGAKRELREETGFEARELVLWKSSQSHSKIDWASYLFIGRDCEKVCEPENDNGEKIKVKLVTFDEFLEIAFSPDFREEHITLALLREGIRKENDKEGYRKIREEIFGIKKRAD